MIESIRKLISVLPAKERRQNIIENMEMLSTNGIDCSECVGICCTFEKNSMRLTPLEALDLFLYLNDNGAITDKFTQSVDAAIKHYRLDYVIPSNGKRNYLRRYYTCPLFVNCENGCPIPPEFKPYGCLGFNPTSPNEKDGTSCTSNTNILKDRDQAMGLQEKQLNKKIKEMIGLTWDKKCLPLAIKFVVEKCFL